MRKLALIIAGFVLAILLHASSVDAKDCTIQNIMMDDGFISCSVTKSSKLKLKIHQKAKVKVKVQQTVSTGGQQVIAGEDVSNVFITSGNASASSTVKVIVNKVVLNLGGSATSTATSTIEIFPE